MTLAEVYDCYQIRPDDEVTVCAACLRASCWQGEFYCDWYRAADITTKTVRELLSLGREHPLYWQPERLRGVR